MVEGRVETLEGGSQRCATRVQARDGAVSSARDEGVGASETRPRACSPGLPRLFTRGRRGRPVLPLARRATRQAAWVRVRGGEARREHAAHGGRPRRGVPVELFRSGQGIEGDAAGERAEPALASDADLGVADAHEADGRDDAKPSPLSSAVGGAARTASSAIMVGRRACASRGACRAVAGARALTRGVGRRAPPGGWPAAHVAAGCVGGGAMQIGQ